MPHTTRPRTSDERLAFRRRCLRGAAAVGFAALVGSALLGGPALAVHGDVSLAGSNFEIDTDANLKVDHIADPQVAIDWASVTEVRQPDEPTGAEDDSFGQGAKEDTEVPSVVDGSIPPNKSDLLNFGLYLEEGTTGDFLHLFWHRVQEPSGTTNMDFEFNQSETTSGNGVTPVRTEGDLLIQYDLSQGGTNPVLSVAYWLSDTDFDGVTVSKADCVASNSLPCWGLRDDLSATGDATGSINTSPIPWEESDGLAEEPAEGEESEVSARTFGEATIDFSAIVGDDCVSFGSAYLKSRSSDSFPAALKDFIAPTETGLNNCGALVVEKTMKDATLGIGQDHPQENVEFTVTGGTLPAAGEKISTDEFGIACLPALEAGTYTVKETVPAGYASTDDEKSAVVAEDTDCDDDPTVSFSNLPLTDVTVSVDSIIPGGTFSSIECDATIEEPDDTEPDVSLDDESDDPSVTLEDLVPGTYTCVVVIDP